ncbi:MAG: M20 family metallo-hydrolase [Lachnospiraceae bacterium]|nr:M20 family metallo-hydrolase [Lachnospiraceae bacterium]
MANANRIQTDLETLRDMTEPCKEGTTRFSYTPAYRRAADYVISQMRAAGLEPREDAVGNIYGLRRGKNPDAPKIISGSHLDTVHCSGYFDGQAGIICALEAARMLEENEIALESDYEVVATIMEEGARFKNLSGSKFGMGVFTEEMLDTMTDDDGITLREAMTAYGLSGDLTDVCRKDEPVKAFLEVHMEQGSRLENQGIDLGIVDTIWGCRWFHLSCKGVTAHPSTPMSERQDTVLATAVLISRMSDLLAKEYVGRATVTVGRIKPYPDQLNAIASETQFTMDFRSGYESCFMELDDALAKEIARVEEEYRVKFTHELYSYTPPTPNHPAIKEALEESVNELGFTSMHMYSGAGHDAMVYGMYWPIAMLFLPSHLGLTHCKDEWCDYETVAKGADVLYETIKKMDAR